ncbi:mannonate dehydratase [Rhodohalobacter sp. 614A]|uniref:mannonate dehydratase n=1 Tax=Rhodohalobacter sp. 614A TaxID=2908649 RepID=UPI001F3B1D34|nr:mannonate dehydratase [Rhodohalobacter sp. 614A]
MGNSRRNFLKKSVSLAALSAAGLSLGACTSKDQSSATDSTPGDKINRQVEWPVTEGPDTPKLCMAPTGTSEKALRRLKQLGIDHVMSYSAPRTPWDEEELRSLVAEYKKGGLSLLNLYISGYWDVIHGGENRDSQIEAVQESIRAAGAVGIPVVEYNWYAHRLMEGYHLVEGRGGAGYTGFEYKGFEDLPPDPEIGVHTAEELWDRLTYFLEAVIPVAEEAGVRMCVHPNDPPIPVSHGSDQILATFDDWKRLIEIVDSPSNGITYDCGVTTELGEDAVEVCRYFGSRDRINHVHFRNVLVDEPYVKYTEVFPDNGQANMFAVMQELVRNSYKYGIYPEHPRELDYDNEHPDGINNQYPGGGGYAGYTYNMGYARAMLQAALIAEGKA